MTKIGVALCVCLVAPGLGSKGSVDLFEERNGIGIVLIHEPSRVLSIYLYDSPDDRANHSRIIEMPYRYEDGRIVDGFQEKWEQLLSFKIDSYTPFLLCMEVRDDWYRVRLSDGRDYWMRQEERVGRFYDKHKFKRLELEPWSVFMANTAWVDRKDQHSNPIRTRPSLKAHIIPYEYGDCLRPVEAKSWWVKVQPQNGESCISDTLGFDLPKGFFKKGWVQWRNDSMFLLRTSPY